MHWSKKQNKNNLKLTGEKPYKCKGCKYFCKLSFQLKIHMRKHSTKTKDWNSKQLHLYYAKYHVGTELFVSPDNIVIFI